jgi:hypothetical protein
VAVTDIKSSKTVIGQGYEGNITATAENHGGFTETFNVTAYANTTIIASQAVTLTSGNFTTLTFTWNTSGFANGNYTLSAYAWPVPGETDTADNNYTYGVILVTIPGEVNGDGSVDMADISLMIDWFMTAPPTWNPNCDVNNDNSIDMADISIAIDNFMQS